MRNVVSQVQRFISTRGGKDRGELPETTAERLWGVVRRVVLVEYEHDDLQTAFRELYEASGMPNVEDEEQYLRLWRDARLHFIRRRLRGEWFPDPHGERAGRWFLRPDGRPRRAWDSLLLVFVMFNAVEVPFVVGCGCPPTPLPPCGNLCPWA